MIDVTLYGIALMMPISIFIDGRRRRSIAATPLVELAELDAAAPPPFYAPVIISSCRVSCFFATPISYDDKYRVDANITLTVTAVCHAAAMRLSPLSAEAARCRYCFRHYVSERES